MSEAIEQWALISGADGTEKSSAVLRVVRALAARGLTLGGVAKEAVSVDGERAYRARRIGGNADELLLLGGQRAPLAAAEPMSFCSVQFDRGAFEQAGDWIRQAARQADVVVIDEVSRLEVARAGYHDAICDALREQAIVLLAVRADQLFQVTERFGLGEAMATLDAGDAAGVEGFVAQLARAARDRRA